MSSGVWHAQPAQSYQPLETESYAQTSSRPYNASGLEGNMYLYPNQIAAQQHAQQNHLHAYIPPHYGYIRQPQQDQAQYSLYQQHGHLGTTFVQPIPQGSIHEIQQPSPHLSQGPLYGTELAINQRSSQNLHGPRRPPSGQLVQNHTPRSPFIMNPSDSSVHQTDHPGPQTARFRNTPSCNEVTGPSTTQTSEATENFQPLRTRSYPQLDYAFSVAPQDPQLRQPHHFQQMQMQFSQEDGNDQGRVIRDTDQVTKAKRRPSPIATTRASRSHTQLSPYTADINRTSSGVAPPAALSAPTSYAAPASRLHSPPQLPMSAGLASQEMVLSKSESASQSKAPMKKARPMQRMKTKSHRRARKRHMTHDSTLNRISPSCSSEEEEVLLPSTTKSGRQVNKPHTFVPMTHTPIARKKRRLTAHSSKRNDQLESDKAPPTDGESMVHIARPVQTDGGCRICTREDSTAGNEIVLCDRCDHEYHQLCIEPNIPNSVVEEEAAKWFCGTCLGTGVVVSEFGKGALASAAKQMTASNPQNLPVSVSHAPSPDGASANQAVSRAKSEGRYDAAAGLEALRGQKKLLNGGSMDRALKHLWLSNLAPGAFMKLLPQTRLADLILDAQEAHPDDSSLMIYDGDLLLNNAANGRDLASRLQQPILEPPRDLCRQISPMLRTDSAQATAGTATGGHQSIPVTDQRLLRPPSGTSSGLTHNGSMSSLGLRTMSNTNIDYGQVVNRLESPALPQTGFPSPGTVGGDLQVHRDVKSTEDEQLARARYRFVFSRLTPELQVALKEQQNIQQVSGQWGLVGLSPSLATQAFTKLAIHLEAEAGLNSPRKLTMANVVG